MHICIHAYIHAYMHTCTQENVGLQSCTGDLDDLCHLSNVLDPAWLIKTVKLAIFCISFVYLYVHPILLRLK